jgi:beta-lactamase superfamily II metal-dependent hydrolase
LISPKGQVVLFDDGVAKNCDKPVSYLQQLGITKIDHHIVSHYHSDHIGCATQVFKEIAMPTVILDRGADYRSDDGSKVGYATSGRAGLNHVDVHGYRPRGFGRKRQVAQCSL